MDPTHIPEHLKKNDQTIDLPYLALPSNKNEKKSFCLGAARVGFEITSENLYPLPVRPVIEFALNCAVLANMVGILDDDSSVHPRNKESVNRSELEAIEDKEEHQKPTSKKQDEKTNRANPCSPLSNKKPTGHHGCRINLDGAPLHCRRNHHRK